MLRNELSEETRADKARDFIGKGCLGREQEGKGTQENCSVTCLTILDFTVMGSVFGLPLASRSDSESFLDGACIAQPRWIPVRRILGEGKTCGISF